MNRFLLVAFICVYPMTVLRADPGQLENQESTAVRAAHEDPEDSADAFLRRHYSDVVAVALPAGFVADGRFPEDVKWMVTVRVLPANPDEERECVVTLRKHYDQKVSVHSICALPTSVALQIRKLLRKQPDDDWQSLAKSMQVEQWDGSETAQAQLRQLAVEFEAIRLDAVLPDELILHGTAYEIWCQSLWGNRMKLELLGPGPEATEQPHPLITWFEKLRTFVESARESKTPSN